jgi:alkylhydroperoxidase family enzyme
LPGYDRELVTLHIAVINSAEYEFHAHVPFALQEGMTQTQVDALRDGHLHVFTQRDRAVLAYCDSMTRDVYVPDAVFDAVRPHFNERELVELTATIAAYNLVSRFLEALQIDHE